MKPRPANAATEMLADPEMTIKEVAGVNRATIYRSLDPRLQRGASSAGSGPARRAAAGAASRSPAAPLPNAAEPIYRLTGLIFAVAEATPDTSLAARLAPFTILGAPARGKSGSLMSRRCREPDANPRSHPSAAGGTAIRLTPTERGRARRPTGKTVGTGRGRDGRRYAATRPPTPPTIGRHCRRRCPRYRARFHNGAAAPVT